MPPFYPTEHERRRLPRQQSPSDPLGSFAIVLTAPGHAAIADVGVLHEHVIVRDYAYRYPSFCLAYRNSNDRAQKRARWLVGTVVKVRQLEFGDNRL
jgi:hypothetical protein